MNNKLILLLSILYLLPSSLAFSETEGSFNYITPPINNNSSHSYNYSEFFDEEFFPYQVNNIDPNINHDKMDVIAKNNNSLNCEGSCVILSKMVIPLDDIFHTSDIDVERQNKVALFSFEIDSNSTFNLNLENNADITIDDNEIHILSSGIDSQQISHPLHPDTTSISFIFEMSNSELKINYMESNQHQKGTPSATITLHSERTRNLNTLPNLVIYNNILNGPLIMSHHLMVRMSADHRTKRGTAGIIGCLLSGPLALYNVVVHGRCNQVESAWASIKSFFSGEDKAKMQLVAGSATALKPKPLTEKPANTWVLTQLDLPSLHQQSLTLPAVANTCHIPLDNLISSRFPRQVDGPACGSWLSRLLADFTLLFGGSLRDWSMEHLRRVLDSAIDSDNTGYAVIDTATERRLLQGIRRGVRELGRTEAINQITSSFHYAESALAHYYLRSHGENTPPRRLKTCL